MAHQYGQQFELDGGKMDFGSGDPNHPPGQVNPKVSGLENRSLLAHPGLAEVPDNYSHPGGKFLHAEGSAK
jgi:hypothetical protein